MLNLSDSEILPVLHSKDMKRNMDKDLRFYLDAIDNNTNWK